MLIPPSEQLWPQLQNLTCLVGCQTAPFILELYQHPPWSAFCSLQGTAGCHKALSCTATHLQPAQRQSNSKWNSQCKTRSRTLGEIGNGRVALQYLQRPYSSFPGRGASHPRESSAVLQLAPLEWCVWRAARRFRSLQAPLVLSAVGH